MVGNDRFVSLSYLDLNSPSVSGTGGRAGSTTADTHISGLRGLYDKLSHTWHVA